MTQQKLIIYNINSFGGSYAYAKEIFYQAEKSKYFSECIFITASNSPLPSQKGILKILLTDQPKTKVKFIRRLHFVYRAFINPLRLYRFLRGTEPSVVIFNDFDQLSSYVWSFLFKKLRAIHKFGVILHDPDRDNYLPVKSLSISTMKMVMSVMDIAYYHGYIPTKRYYKEGLRKIEIPHGIYLAEPVDKEFESFLVSAKGAFQLIGILGNIRDEKNYALIIEALKFLPNVKLLIAGAVANSKVPVFLYKQKMKELGLESRVIWIEKYMTEKELSAAIHVCDVISLYYKGTFTSQSGIINTIAPFKKKVIVSDTESSLKQVVSKYSLGIIAKQDELAVFVEGIKELLRTKEKYYNDNWEKYMSDHSWKKNVNIIAESFEKINSSLTQTSTKP